MNGVGDRLTCRRREVGPGHHRVAQLALAVGTTKPPRPALKERYPDSRDIASLGVQMEQVPVGRPWEHRRDGMSRRRALKIGALVAGGVWTAPVVQPIALSAASAQAPSWTPKRGDDSSGDHSGTETDVSATARDEKPVPKEFADAHTTSSSTGRGVNPASEVSGRRTGSRPGGSGGGSTSRSGSAASPVARPASPTVGSNISLTG